MPNAFEIKVSNRGSIVNASEQDLAVDSTLDSLKVDLTQPRFGQIQINFNKELIQALNANDTAYTQLTSIYHGLGYIPVNIVTVSAIHGIAGVDTPAGLQVLPANPFATTKYRLLAIPDVNRITIWAGSTWFNNPAQDISIIGGQILLRYNIFSKNLQ